MTLDDIAIKLLDEAAESLASGRHAPELVEQLRKAACDRPVIDKTTALLVEAANALAQEEQQQKAKVQTRLRRNYQKQRYALWSYFR